MSELILSQDLSGFFHGEISNAREVLGVEISEDTEYYLVNMLCEYSHSSFKPPPGREPLAFMYKKAVESTPQERISHLKELGDVALYTTGFFAESIERSLVDIDYYISMGGGAYRSVSSLMSSRRNGDVFGDLYAELGTQFTELVDLLSEISEKQKNTDGELLRLYDRWVRTGSDRVRKILLEQGMLPAPDMPSEYEQ